MLRPLTDELRPVVEQLWQLYRHDLSDFRGWHTPDGFVGTLPDAHGRYKTSGLESYLADGADTAGYLLEHDGHPVGFAFVDRISREPHLMAEFFVVRGLRRHGIGRAAVAELFARHPGVWEIPFQEANEAGARFWRRVAAAADPNVREELRPVPGKPEVPDDVWLTVHVESRSS